MTEENENLDEVLQDESQLEELLEEAANSDEQEVVAELTPEQRIAELQDKNVRLLAEMDNVRKRAMRDASESRKYAAMPLITDLLSMTDNLQRALDAADAADSVESLKNGVDMVLQGIVQIFQKYSCQPIPTEVGQAFDMNLHEAVGMQPSEDHPANSIMMVASQGYELHDRVLRPSQVIVSSGSPQSDSDSIDAESADDPVDADEPATEE